MDPRTLSLIVACAQISPGDQQAMFLTGGKDGEKDGEKEGEMEGEKEGEGGIVLQLVGW